jgi:hypothetical protein
MFASQSNTQPGDVLFVAGEDLTGKEGRLVVLSSVSGVPTVLLPTALTDKTPYLLVDGGLAGSGVTVRPFEPMTNHRVRAKGASLAGDVLVTADPATPADKGKLRKLPVASGSYIAWAIAEETIADGQLGLTRPYGPITVVVP